MRRVILGTGLLFAALAAAAIVWALQRPWIPRADFDVLGFLWLLGNLPKLFVLALAVLMAGLSAYLLLKGRALRGLADGRSLDDESRRILQDPRFYGILAPHARRSSDPARPPSGTGEDAAEADPPSR